MYKSRPSAPFKPPRLVAPSQVATPETTNNKVKKRSSNPPDDSNSLPESKVHRRDVFSVKRTKIKHVPQVSTPEPVPTLEPVPSTSKVEKYMVQWRKRTTKKNKTWDGDGFINVQYFDNNTACHIVFKDEDGKQMGKKSLTNLKPDVLEKTLAIGQYELEVDCKVDSFTDNSRDLPSTEIIETFPEISTSFKKVAPANRPVIVKPTPNKSIILPLPPQTTKEVVPVHIDPILGAKLRPHQVEGVTFLYECLMGFRDYEGNGCLLADEMGLGKTLMTITLIWTLYKQNPFVGQPKVNKILICCPVTLINNWKLEFKKWLGMNKINILTLNSNSSISEKQNLVSFGRLNIYQVLIINYEKVSTYFNELADIKFDLLVCDEGHRLKSSSNKVMNHLTNLAIPKKIMLTGTPIQNDLVEFYTIINFINPGVLGDFKLFQKMYIAPILKSRDVNCYDPTIKKNGELISNMLINLTKKFMLRRTQSILLNYLTTKTDIILFVPPTEPQIKLFNHLTNLKSFNQLFSDSSNQAFAMINLFKKICNSPSLLVQDELFKSLIEDENLSTSLATSSGKINVLIPLLLEISSFHEKTVIVSNYTKTLDLLEVVLKKLNLSFLRLDGSTPKNVRNKLVGEFNKSSPTSLQVFLLSSKSGGMGINLVGASRLILFDNDWNPAVDLQSMSRIHRDGQQKPCFIYRLLTTGCIDEKIFQRQLMKNNLSSKFLDDNSSSKSDVFDYSDLKNLFEIETSTISNTHDLLECDCAGIGDNKLEKQTDDDSDNETDDDNPLKQNSWMSALDLQDKLESQSPNSSIKSALTNYKHFNPNATDKETIQTQIRDQALVNIILNKTFENSKVPISYIMMNTFEKDFEEDQP